MAQLFQRDLYGSAGIGMAQGVGGQVFHRLLQPCPVPGEGYLLQLQLKLEIFLFQGQGKGGKHLPYQGGQVHRFLFRCPVCLRPGQIQQAAHQSGHAVALREYHVQVLLPLLRGDVLPQGLGVGTEDGQGSFQFVGRRPGKVPLPLDGPALAVVGKESHGNGGQQGIQGGGF